MNQREARLISERMKAPDLSDIHLVLRSEPSRNLNRACRHVQVKRRSDLTQVRPLRHGFEVVDGFGRFYLDSSNQLVAAVSRRKYQIREELNLPDANWSGLRFTNVRHDVALAFEAHHEESNDAIVLELLAHGADEDGAHGTSRRRRTNRLDSAGAAIIVRSQNPSKLYTAGVRSCASCLDGACLYPSE